MWKNFALETARFDRGFSPNKHFVDVNLMVVLLCFRRLRVLRARSARFVFRSPFMYKLSSFGHQFMVFILVRGIINIIVINSISIISIIIIISI